VDLLFTCLHSAETVRLLKAHGVPLEEVGEGLPDPGDSSALWFPTLEGALRWCEGSLLRVAQGQDLCSLDRPRMTLAEILEMHMQHPQALYHDKVDADRAARDLQRVMKKRTLQPGEVLFSAGDPSDDVYFIVEGSLTLLLRFQVEDRTRLALPGATQGSSSVDRLFEYPPGSIVGQDDFLMCTPRTATASCGQACVLHVVPRAAFDTLRQRSPEALIILTSVMLRAGAIKERHALDTLGAAQV